METASVLSPSIPFTSDYGFKVTFGNEDNTWLLCRALQALIGSERTIVDVVFDKTTFEGITRDSRSGVLYLKVVNTRGAAQPIDVRIGGASRIEAEGETVTLAAGSPDDTNSLDQPQQVVPRIAKANGLGPRFVREFPAYSVTVLKVKAK